MQDAGMRRRWRLRHGSGRWAGTDRAARLADALRINPLISTMLLSRGIEDQRQADRFLHPKLTHLHDPALLPGAVRAADRMAKAVRDHQPIVIYGDYDVDGITGIAILWHVLRRAGADVRTYLPHRLEEGYGLNKPAITQLGKSDPRPLIVTVDCGITAVDPARTARRLGLDLIITDHHSFDPDNLPDTFALVHPRLGPAANDNGKSAYPFGDLCGAAVAFKLAWQFARAHCGSQRVPASTRDLLVDLLSFVALGTIADVAPLLDENRVLTAFGLSRMSQTGFHGLNALIDAARLRGAKVDDDHVGFVLAPRLNACGRMGHAGRALRLLTEAGEREAAGLAQSLTADNDRRRTTERAIFAEANQMVLDAGYHAEDRRAIVVGKAGWHPGVIGIVASRLVERFGRPVVLLNYDNGIARGSARSVEGVSIHDAFTACRAHLDQFGGHAMAAGLQLRSDRVDAFREQMIDIVNQKLDREDLVGSIDVDAEFSLTDCSLEMFDQIDRLAPFGRGNERPNFVLRGAVLDRRAQTIGPSGSHLSLMLRQDGRVCRAVAFGMGDRADQLPRGAAIDVLFESRVSTWQGRRRPDLHVRDIKLLTAVA